MHTQTDNSPLIATDRRQTDLAKKPTQRSESFESALLAHRNQCPRQHPQYQGEKRLAMAQATIMPIAIDFSQPTAT